MKTKSFLTILLLAACAQFVSANGYEITASARSQIGKTTSYDPSYRSLPYPGGDVPLESGVCTDVVIRALRDGLQIDLQQLVHEDMTQSFSRYPQNWGLSRPDKNIDHRRVPNLQAYFTLQGYQLPHSNTPSDYQPGDLVTCTVGGRLPHIMVVSDKLTANGTPLVLHNIGSGTQEEDRLFEFPITGHYRIGSHRPADDTSLQLQQTSFTLYEVGSESDGGTLSGISKRFYGTASKWKLIYDANRNVIKNPNLIQKGMKLRIPTLSR